MGIYIMLCYLHNRIGGLYVRHLSGIISIDGIGSMMIRVGIIGKDAFAFHSSLPVEQRYHGHHVIKWL